jgi:PTH1 family peptidyl-tRNA hydrolase
LGSGILVANIGIPVTTLGFMVLDEIVKRYALTWSMAPAQVPDAFVAKKFGPVAVLLAKPLTYMNLSGDAAAGLLRYYDVDAADLLVVVDDIDIPFGRLRARASGSAGTHNGLRSVVERLGTGFSRLRVGVGRGDARRDLADHVLAKFEPANASSSNRSSPGRPTPPRCSPRRASSR